MSYKKIHKIITKRYISFRLSKKLNDAIIQYELEDTDMISKKMEHMVANSSAIRAMFEEGNRLAKLYGPENVYDFSLGNPNVPAPEAVKQAVIDIVTEEDPLLLHGYTNSNAG